MTGRTRDKRCTKITIVKKDENGNKTVDKEIIPDIRMDAPIKDGENSTYGDMIADKNNVESKIFQKDEREEWHREVKDFFASLSPLQREIAFMLSDNYMPDEICEELHISMNHYNNSVKRIFADEKIKILRPLVERK